MYKSNESGSQTTYTSKRNISVMRRHRTSDTCLTSVNTEFFGDDCFQQLVDNASILHWLDRFSPTVVFAKQQAHYT